MITSELEKNTDYQISPQEIIEDDVEQRELDLSKAEDLDIFLKSSERVHSEAFEYENVAKVDNYSRLDFKDIPGNEVFSILSNKLAELKERIDKCRQEIVFNEGEIVDEDVDVMQQLYNDIISFRNHIQDTYADEELLSPIQVDEFADENESKMNTLEAEPIDDEWVTVFEVEKLSEDNIEQVVISSSNDKTLDETKSPTESVEAHVILESGSTKEDLFETTEQTIQGIKTEIQAIKKRLLLLFPATEIGDDVTNGLSELDVCLERISNLQEKVDGIKTTNESESVIKGSLSKYERVAHEIEKNAQIILQVLLQKSEEDASVSGVTKVETEPVKIDAPSLIKRVDDNQFYTEEERGTVQELLKSLNQSIAENVSTSEISQNYEELKLYINKLENEPERKHINKRVCRILERVTARRPGDALVVETIKAKCDLVVRAQSDSEKTDSDVQKLYKSLEQYVKDHEEKWVTVCGNNVPVAGREGVPAAHSLRECLMTSRDRHKELQKYPEKKVLVDKLVRKLSVVPKEGFNQTDVSEITELARRIDVASSFEFIKSPAETKSLENAEHTDNSVDLNDDTISNGQASKRGPMNISGGDEEGVVQIHFANKIAKKTEARLQKEVSEDVKKVEETKPLVTNENIKTIESKVIAEVEMSDPINEVVPDKVPTIVHADLVHEETSLSREYLNNERYLSFIKKHYTSPRAFERILDAVVTQIESQTVDMFERWLKEESTSPFTLIQGLLVSEVEKLSLRSDVRQILAQENIKYETFLGWVDLIPEMKRVIGYKTDIEFGELYAKWMIESEMANYKESAVV